MRRIVSIAALVLSASLASGVAPAAPEVGEPAPAFALRGSDGEDYALSQFVGKEAVVLAWFPKAFTPG